MFYEQNKNNLEDVARIVACLQYLECEAKKANLPDVNILINKTIADIDEWISGDIVDKYACYEKIINSDLCKMISLIQKFSVASRLDIEEILTVINAYSDVVSTRKS